MGQKAGYFNLDECIYDYIDQSEQSNHKYFKLFNIAFRGMEQMGLSFFYKIRSVKLPVNANKTVTLPSDYIKYSKIGVFNATGEVICLKYNDKLSLFADLLPDRQTKTEDNSLFNLFQFNFPIFYNWWNGYNFQNLFGIPSGGPFLGSFNIDNANGVILLNQDFIYDYLLIEYVAAPIQGETYYVPIEFRNAMIAWLGWQDIAFVPSKTHVNNTNVQMRRHDFFNERRLAIATYRPFHLQEAYEWSLENQRLCVKS